MQVTETLSEGLKRGFTVVLAAADIETRRTARLTDLGKTLRLPGFRPGKVPLPVVRQRYGTAVTAEVLEQSVSDAFATVLSERGLRAAMQPKVDLVSADPTRDLEFKLEVELLPEIALPDFGSVELTRLKAEAAPDTVDKALAEIANRNRELVEITAEERGERGADKGETVVLDYVGSSGRGGVSGRPRHRRERRGRRAWLHPGLYRADRGHPTGRDPKHHGDLPRGLRRQGTVRQGGPIRNRRQVDAPARRARCR